MLVVYVATAHMLLSMMACVIESRKRKRHGHAAVGHISYGPIYERDRKRMEYLDKIWKSDVTCVNMLRLNRSSFFRFCQLIRNRGLLQDTIHMCVDQQIAMFLHTIGYNVRNRLVGTNFARSGETVSRYFNKVLHTATKQKTEPLRSSLPNTKQSGSVPRIRDGTVPF
jgi:hypothetical protein